MKLVREVVQDAQHSLRLWSRRPLHTGFAIAALAIGIGANVGTFSVVNALLLRSLPFRDPGRLVVLGAINAPHESAKQFHDWRKQSTYLDDVAIFDRGDVNLGGLREPVRVQLTETSWNFFSMLGTQPVLGRGFSAEEDTPGRDGAAVISYGLWQQFFGGDPRVLGATIRANGAPLTIIGVAPPGFDYPWQTVLWTPTLFDPKAIPKAAFLLEAIARVRSDVTWPQAREAFAAEADRLAPKRRAVDKIRHPPRMTPLQDELAGPVKNASLMLMAGVALILLIACANVSNLLLARTADRASELSIRSALGASRARLSRQLLTESVLLSLVASVAGILVAYWTASVAAKVQPAPIAAQSYAILDIRVLSFAVAISVLSGLLFGVLPSLYAARTPAFGSRGASTRRGSRIARETLIAAQIMLTIVLLASSVSLGRAFLNLTDANHGFDKRGLITVRVALDGTIHESGDSRLQYFQEAVARVQKLPGVRDASATEFLPLAATAFLGAPFTMDGRPAQEFSMIVPVLSGYFETMGARMLYGREFTDAEVRSDARVAVVNELFAQEFGDPAAALGHEIRAGAVPGKIVGVVKRMEYLGDDNPTQVFLPDHSPGKYFVTIVARVDGRAEDHIAMIRDAVKSVDPEVPVFDVKTMDERFAEAMVRPKFYSAAVLLFAAFALMLAVIGIYGIVSYAVTQRTHEMGVRMALGTTPGSLRGILLRQGLVSVAAGAIPGVAGALLAGRFLESLIDGAKTVSAPACAASVIFIGMIAGTSIWAATRRIARLDIMEIIRAE